MKPRLSVLLAGLIVALFASATTSAMAAGAAAENSRQARPMDCAKAKDKARCEILNQKIQQCKDKTDDDWRACMYGSQHTASFTPPLPRDCSKARNKEACEAHAAALQACMDKLTRAEHRKCVAGRSQAGSLKKD